LFWGNRRHWMVTAMTAILVTGLIALAVWSPGYGWLVGWHRAVRGMLTWVHSHWLNASAITAWATLLAIVGGLVPLYIWRRERQEAVIRHEVSISGERDERISLRDESIIYANAVKGSNEKALGFQPKQDVSVLMHARGEFNELRQAIEQALVRSQGHESGAGPVSTNLTFESFDIRADVVTFSASLRPGRQRVILRMDGNAYLSAAEREKFIEEVRLAENVADYSHIARILGGKFTSLGYPFVMQLIDGEAVPVRPPLPAAQVIDVGRGLADALDVAHSRGVSFGIIEPLDILLTSNGEPVLAFPHLPMFTPLEDGATAAARDVASLCAALLTLLPRLQDSSWNERGKSASLEVKLRKLLESGIQPDQRLRPSAPVLREGFYELKWEATGTWGLIH
jgi:hypothetical protein